MEYAKNRPNRKGQRKQVIWLDVDCMKSLQRMCFEQNTNLSVVLSQIATKAIEQAVEAHDSQMEDNTKPDDYFLALADEEVAHD